MTSIILQLIFITTCIVWAIKISTDQGMVFEKVGDWAHKNVEEGCKIYDVLLLCPFCMPSIYSSVSYFLGYQLGIWSNWKILWAYPIVVGGSSLCAGLIWTIYQLIGEIKHFFSTINDEQQQS